MSEVIRGFGGEASNGDKPSLYTLLLTIEYSLRKVTEL